MKARLTAEAMKTSWADLFGVNNFREFKLSPEHDLLFEDTQSGKTINVAWLEELKEMENV